MNLWLVHPDQSLRASLLTTLKPLWTGLNLQDFSPDTVPDTAPAGCFALTSQMLGQLPADRQILLATTPQRLKSLLLQLDSLIHQSQWPARLSFTGASLETRTREWCEDGTCLTLTEKEVAVLVYLWQQSDAVSREDLLRDVWHYAADTDTHTIETHIYRLRQKIEKDPANPEFLITTKDGYQLAAASSA